MNKKERDESTGPCDYCGSNVDDWRGMCPTCSGQTCGECSCGAGMQHFDCENCEEDG